MVNVTFYGVRGSTPCSSDANQRYGGNTACVAIESPGSDPITLDIGTGLRFWGATLPHDGSFRGHALITHLHWDHVQGLPFFVPINRPGAHLDLWGPKHDGGSLGDAFAAFMRPPYFPVELEALAGAFEFHDLGTDDVVVGDAKVKSRFVPHVGPTLGFRLEIEGTSIAYIPDHQQPMDGSFTVADEVLELVDDVDLLIHDAQYTPDEFAQKSHWGHCTIDYALHVAKEGGARRLALFHHDPEHGDDQVDRLVAEARASDAGRQLDEVLGAFEGLTLSFDA